ncbi:MAG TPA: peptidoglycan recognition protein [Gaiellaceae bacterium]|nr:peptidoglycan recognition protein [Gaiellaceae bacterium]
MRRLLLTAAALAALVHSGQALAGTRSSVTMVELQANGRGAYVPLRATRPFTLAGVQWRGAGRVVFRTRSRDGRWSEWRRGAPEAEDGPDAGSSEDRESGWQLGNPWWVGPATAIEARAVGRVSNVRAHLVWSPELRVPYRAVATADAPPIVPRLSWGADESIRRGPPSYAANVGLAIVHHTAGRNDYSRAEAAAIVKAIQLFHVQGNGWNDIGYNFLVDRFGTVYEGRFGGIERSVVGAHAQGFNTGSVGVALLGTYGSTQPSKAAQDAIARLLAWRLDVAHVDPTSFLTFISGGSERYASGIPVTLRALSGHRDTGFTECPGNALYGKLDSLSASARASGLPKLFEPLAEVSGSAVRFQARLSSVQLWDVIVTDASGVEVARGSGSGIEIDWTWDSAGAPTGSFTWTMAVAGARSALGVVRAGGAAPALAIEAAASDPEAISPNGDGQADTAVLTYRLNAAANVTIEVVDLIGGILETVVDRVWTRAGQHAVEVDGTSLADGRYTIVITARTAAGAMVQRLVPLTVTRTLGVVTVTPAAFSPNGDGRKDRIALSFSLAAAASVRFRVVRDDRWVANPLFASFLPGPQRFVWDGVRSTGTLRDGSYQAIVDVDDGVGAISHGVPFVSDTVAPRVRILPGPMLRVEVSEPAVLTLRIGGRALRREVERAGTVRIPWKGAARRVRVVAWDAAGNASHPVVRISRTRTGQAGQ